MPIEQFSGEPKALWITGPDPDRNMQLLEDFWFFDRQGKQWMAPNGLITDGASIPRALWTLIGSPFTGDYRRAALVHDYACDQDGGDPNKRAEADRMFYEACRAGGCSVRDATVLYIGVRIGAQWDARTLDNGRPRLTRTFTDTQIEQDFQEVSDQVLNNDLVDDPLVIEQWTNDAMETVRRQRAKALTIWRP